VSRHNKTPTNLVGVFRFHCPRYFRRRYQPAKPTALNPSNSVPGSGTSLTGGGLPVSGGGLPVSGGGGSTGGGSTGGGGSTIGGSGSTATGGTVENGRLNMMNAEAVEPVDPITNEETKAGTQTRFFNRLIIFDLPLNPDHGSQNAHDRSSCQGMFDRTMPKSSPILTRL